MYKVYYYKDALLNNTVKYYSLRITNINVQYNSMLLEFKELMNLLKFAPTFSTIMVSVQISYVHYPQLQFFISALNFSSTLCM